MPLNPSNSSNHSSRFEQVLAEILVHEEQGRHIDVEDYCRSFPELADPLRDYFRNRAHFARLAPALLPPPAASTDHERNRSRIETTEYGSAAAKPPADWPADGRFGGYEVRRELGHGGRGIVYEVSDPELNRPLAVKVLRSELREDADAVRRFLEEAQLTGQLQHPGIVPIHSVGRLADGRPYFAMKQIQGRTLADLLGERTTPTQDLPRFLVIFQQVCQAVAYAHSRGVIHRDLKPANVMVGAFAEVQVMDWGLAKVLTPETANRQSPPDECGTSAPKCADTIRTVRTELIGLSSAEGTIVGTIPYMAPEQARGEGELVGARADVFGLGAVLCEVLTGLPPYIEASTLRLHLIAATGDLAAAFARLDRCGADAALIALAKDCLAPERERRPREAGVVAERVALHLAEVQERLRRAEVEKAAAEARAEEARATMRAERRARRLTVGLVAAGLAVLLLSAGGGWWFQRQRAERQAEAARQAEALRQTVATALDQAARFRQSSHFEEGRELLEQTRQRLGADGPTDLRGQVEQALADIRLTERLDAARQRALVVVEGVKFNWVGTEQEYAAALQGAGLGRESEDAEVVAARVRVSEVRAEVVAALDDWAGITGDEARREWLLAVARAADPDPLRNRLRQPALWQDAVDLARLAKEARVAELSPHLSHALARVLLRSGGNAVPLLREAQAHHSSDFWLNFGLGLALAQGKQWNEAVGYYRAALALRPTASPVHNNLANVLHAMHQLDAAATEYRQAVALDPKIAGIHSNLSSVLRDLRQLDEAVAECRQAIALDPNLAAAHNNFGAALEVKGQMKAAEAEYRQAISLDPNDAVAHCNLGNILRALHQLDAALVEYRKAVALAPKDAAAHNNLGVTLHELHKLDEAVAEFRLAIDLDAKFIQPHNNLGNALRDLGQCDAAVAEFRRAIALGPNDAAAHNNLGNVLRDLRQFDAAVAAFRRAISLDPKLSPPHYNLAETLRNLGQVDAAVDEYRRAIDLDPKDAKAHANLGSTLCDLRQFEEAVTEIRKAIALDPAFPSAHDNLGVALAVLHRMDEAAAEFRRAIALNPKDAKAHYDLGNALADLRQLDAAVAEYREAIKLNPDSPETHCNLGHALRQKGAFAESLASLKRGHKLGLKSPDWRYPSLQWVQQAERLVALESKLSDFFKGTSQPADNRERLGLAEICVPKKHYRAAVRLYADAFTVSPMTADDLRRGHRYNAARCAALAAAGRGADNPPPDATERVRLRRQALGWLRADLAFLKKQAESGKTESGAVAQQILQHWLSDPALACVRDGPGLATLPEREQKAWKKLWADVEALQKRARETK